MNFNMMMNIALLMKCPKCGYEWNPRVTNPKECPRCKNYIVRK
jgi:predicted Zn-ribbon and HTH transcriptional regulator